MSIFLEELSKLKFLHFFEEIAKIPRGSQNTRHIADYLVSFAKARGLSYDRDESDNVIIRKNASVGFESRPTVIIQGHTDMVIAKAHDIKRDMTAEGVELLVEGDLLKARGTTLGADNGIAVAYILAVLSDENINHPKIEALFTSDEEIGMIGATNLDPSRLQGRILINLDSEEEGYFTVGCAGGICNRVSFSARKEKGHSPLKRICVKGLVGGHSGVEIHKGGANAIRVLGEILEEIRGVKISDLAGGNADNAIPKEACATVYASSEFNLDKISESISKKYADKEPNILITVSDGGEDHCFSIEDSKSIISLINTLPNGIIKMSEDIDGLVETSLNLGVIKTDDCGVNLSYALRSSKREAKNELREKVLKIAKAHGATVSEEGDYPPWEYRKDSYIRELSIKIFEKMYGRKPTIMAIHAGLECGLLSEKLSGLDCISIGPDLYDVHTTDERASISSAIRVWEFLVEILRNV